MQVHNNKYKINSRITKIQLNIKWTVILTMILALFVTLSTFYIQPILFKMIVINIMHQPFILLLNYLPPLMILVLVYFIVNNLFYSAAITSFIFNTASLINSLKIQIRDEPFSPKDIQLIKEATNTVSDFHVQMKYDIIALIIVIIFVLCIVACVLQTQKFNSKVRLLGAGGIVILIILMNKFLYGSQEIYCNKLQVSNRSNITKVYNELGFIYCFLYNLNSNPIEKAASFSEEEVEKLITTYTEKNIAAAKKLPKERPHIIFIMSEAFSDIGMNEPFTYNKENDPYKYWREVVASPNTITGHLVVPNVGGGTSNTEFDVMTGMQTNMLSSIPTYAFRVINRDLQSIARVLEKNNYQTLFMHPGNNWFYNREQAYQYLGIDEEIFSEAFKEEDKKGNMVADSVLTEHIINEFEKHVLEGNNKPLFSYVTTIQNHMPYLANKYGDLNIGEVKTSKELSQDAKDYLSVYMEGIKDASKMIKDLTDYFEEKNESVIIVFFGDHLPNLGDNYLAYKELGLNIGGDSNIEGIIDTYSTPYIIWANKEAAKNIDLKRATKTLGLSEDNRISANYLGAMVLELLGYKGQNAFFDYINELRRIVPIIHNDTYEVMGEGYTRQLDNDKRKMIDNLRNWEYYKMCYEDEVKE